MKTLLLLCFFPILSYGQKGKVELVRTIFNFENPRNNSVIKITIWYVGNITIQEVPHLDINTDSSGSKTNLSIKYFLLINPESHEYYYFSSFVDTAKIVERSRKEEILGRLGGWNMHSKLKFDYDSLLKLKDTIIGKLKYGRTMYIRKNSGHVNSYVLYSTCTNKSIPVKYLNAFADEIPCPITRMDTYFDARLAGVTQLVTIADSLTKNEQKVFDAWCKNISKIKKVASR